MHQNISWTRTFLRISVLDKVWPKRRRGLTIRHEQNWDSIFGKLNKQVLRSYQSQKKEKIINEDHSPADIIFLRFFKFREHALDNRCILSDSSSEPVGTKFCRSSQSIYKYRCRSPSYPSKKIAVKLSQPPIFKNIHEER